MARVLRHQKLVNPAKRLSLKQKLHFGTARQRAAAKLALGHKGKTKRKPSTTQHRRRVVRANPIGTIITLGANPGKVGTMATRKRSTRRRATHRNPARKHRNPIMAHRKRTRRNPTTYVARRRRVRNVRHHTGRRNPNFAGTGMKVVGVIGGAALTKLVTAMLPASFQTGILKYLATGVVAFGLGWGVGKVGKSPELGSNITVGGLTLLGLQVLSDFVPGIAAYSGLNVSGMGNLITPSSFYTPQVPMTGTMTQFVVPANVPAMAVSGGKGRAMGRLAVTRGGGY